MSALKGHRLKGCISCLGLLAAAFAVPSGAAEQRSTDGSTYARIRHVEDSVTLVSMEDGAIVEGSLNTPVAPGDRVTSDRGRAEIELADGSVVWLDEGTDLHFRSLADFDSEFETTNLLALQRGSIRVAVRDTGGADVVFQIDSEGGSVYLLSAGSFRIDAEGGMTTVSTFRGVAEFSGDGGSVLVRSGERGSVQSARAPTEPRRFNTLRVDDFDRFCEARAVAYVQEHGDDPIDAIEADLPAPVRPYVGELSAYGGWHSVPTYGRVWRPSYSGVWGPYVAGHWTWCPTGWAWVSYEPWGWAPYHYGRWDHLVDLGWVWIPGAHWSGAWVSFAVGSGYIGWSPLNYYNYPVFHDAHIHTAVTVNAGRLDARGWRFTPVGRFNERGGGRRVVRGDRVPRDSELVVTRRLPRFDPRATAARPERGEALVRQVRAGRTPLPAERDRAGAPVPFRTVERRGLPGRRPEAPRRTLDPRAGIRLEGRGPTAPGGVAPPASRPQARQRLARPGPRAPEPRGRSEPRRTRSDRARPPADDRDDKVRDKGEEPRREGAGAPVGRSGGGGPPAGRNDPPQARERGKRPAHVVERLFQGARRSPPRERAAPPRSGTGSSARATGDRKSAGGGTSRPPRSADKGGRAKDKEKSR